MHEADLVEKTDTTSGPWTVADDWQLIMWLLAVSAFRSMLGMSIDHEDQVARDTGNSGKRWTVLSTSATTS